MPKTRELCLLLLLWSPLLVHCNGLDSGAPNDLASHSDLPASDMATNTIVDMAANTTVDMTTNTPLDMAKPRHDGGGGSPSDLSMSTPRDLSTPPGSVDMARPSGWPNATNTGYKNAPGYPGSLTTCATPIQSGQTYRYCDFSSGAAIGSATNHPTNVTFYGCRFASNEVVDATVADFGDGVVFQYCTFEPSRVSAPPTQYSQGYQYAIDLRYAGQLTIEHSDFWGWANAIQFWASTQAKPLVIRDSWFHDARDDGGLDHTDAILSNNGGPTYMVFDHNTIVSVGNTNGLALQVDSKAPIPYDHVTVTNNYFSGFGNTVNTGGNTASTNMTFTGNTFGTDIKPDFGPLYGDKMYVTKGLGGLWRNNHWHVVPGSYYTNTSDDGKYWWPDGTLSGTDYTGP